MEDRIFCQGFLP